MDREQSGEFISRVERLLRNEEFAEARRECRGFCRRLGGLAAGGAQPDGECAKALLQLLRSMRQFEMLLEVAEAALQGNRAGDFTIHQLYAQALIETGKHVAALYMLAPLEKEARRARSEDWEEVAGLMGRTYKQRYVLGRHASDLANALEWYRHVYRKRRLYWHGINAVALAWRARRDRVALAAPVDLDELTGQVEEDLGKTADGERDYWWHATAAENCIARNEIEAARDHLVTAVRRQDADAFATGSTLRQFDEIWDLDQEPGDLTAFIDILRSCVLHAPHGHIVREARAVGQTAAAMESRTRSLERVLGDVDPVPFRWYLEANLLAQRIGRVWQGRSRGVGTGFLLADGACFRPEDPEWSGQPVFCTCNHVISRAGGNSLRPEEVTITFDALAAQDGAPAEPVRYRVVKILWESGPERFDTTCLRLEPVEERLTRIADFELIKEHRALPSTDNDRVYIIGHPDGGELAFSFQDNNLFSLSADRIRYKTPTKPGNSGSPLFNEALQLIGIHHACVSVPEPANPESTRLVNEGIPLPALIEAIRSGETA